MSSDATRAVPVTDTMRGRVRAPSAPPARENGRVAGGATTSVKPASKRSRRRAAAVGQPARRVVRRIDTWTVFKLSILFYFCVFAVLLIAGIILWNVAASFGVLTHIEKFIRSLFDLTTFRFRAPIVLEAAAAAGGILIFIGTLINVLAVVVYNLTSDMLGGVQVVVIEEVV
jgi:hypothetical protein